MFKTILVPVAPEAPPGKALDAAIEFAKIFGGRIVALSVAEPQLVHSTEIGAEHEREEVEAAKRVPAAECLENVAEIASANNVPCESVISQSAVPSDEIIDVARRYRCDVIFIATYGQMGVLDTVLRESETQSLLRKTPIPVLVFPRMDEAQG